ncbi:MAG TPA: DUF1517 domain-containing protein [Kofleriaceae bacterium]
MGIRALARRAFVIVCLLIGTSASADTGGSMGGGDWGGGGGGGGGDSSSSSSSHDYSSSSNDYSSGYTSSGSSGGGCGSTGGMIALLVLVGIFWLVSKLVEQAKHQPLSLGAYAAPTGDQVDVSVVRIAIDARARKFVQAELARIAKIADTATQDGRAAMLREVTLMLRRVRDAWVYGGAVNEPVRFIGNAKPVFDQHVMDARARFQHQTVQNEQGKVHTQAAPDYTPRSHEGEGLILVTIVVAARGELFTVAHIGDGEDLRKALEASSHRSPRDLVAIEIIWQPAEDADRLSSIELEAKYPRPDLIPITGALVGKMFCSYCGGPYPAELVSCPHCGGRADAERPLAA